MLERRGVPNIAKGTLLKLAGRTSFRNIISICQAILDQKNNFDHTLLEQERVRQVELVKT